MFAISVELLAGRYVATAYNDRTRAEWPPHPARLFSAMVAAWGEGETSSALGQRERAALQWVECLDAPVVLADPLDRVGLRSDYEVFVPVNDATVVGTKTRTAFMPIAKPTAGVIEQGLSVLPDSRVRQSRRFPTAVPEHPRVAFLWESSDCPPEHLLALSGLAARVARLGHSSSLVDVKVGDGSALDDARSVLTAHVPDVVQGTLVLRWVREGQLAALEAAHARDQETEPRVLPKRDVAYRVGGASTEVAPAASVFSPDLIIFARQTGPRLPITAAAQLAAQLRRALHSVAGEPLPAVISGHDVDGTPLARPHLAYVPLPVVSGPHADGALLGIALAMPRNAADREAVLRALQALENKSDEPGTVRLTLGALGELTLGRDPWGEEKRATLRAASWVGPSRRWASATPVALDRNPGDLHDADPEKRRAAFAEATATILAAVQHIGLPAPASIDVVRSTVLPGSAKPRVFPRFPLEASKQPRVLVHVRLAFDRPVCGPVLIGAGRYLGLGLCAPVDE